MPDEGGDGAERYRLLETVRHYGRERLLAAGGTEAVHRHHAEYFLVSGDPLEAELADFGKYVFP